MTKRVNKKDAPFDEYIGRGSDWGNPWSHLTSKFEDVTMVASRGEACDKYEDWITFGDGRELLKKVRKLRGKTLGCFCDPEVRCHGDTLIKLANMRRYGVIGSRDFNDFKFAERCINQLRGYNEVCIVSGGAKGADSIAKDYAEKYQLPFVVYPADWSKGKGAGFLRNTQIVEDCDLLVCFWDGKSRGTKDSIDKARERKINTVLFYF